MRFSSESVTSLKLEGTRRCGGEFARVESCESWCGEPLQSVSLWTRESCFEEWLWRFLMAVLQCCFVELLWLLINEGCRVALVAH